MGKISQLWSFLFMITLISGCNGSGGNSFTDKDMDCPDSIEITAIYGTPLYREIGCDYIAAIVELQDEPEGVELTDEFKDRILVSGTVAQGTYTFEIVVTEILGGDEEKIIPVTLNVL